MTQWKWTIWHRIQIFWKSRKKKSKIDQQQNKIKVNKLRIKTWGVFSVIKSGRIYRVPSIDIIDTLNQRRDKKREKNVRKHYVSYCVDLITWCVLNPVIILWITRILKGEINWLFFLDKCHQCRNCVHFYVNVSYIMFVTNWIQRKSHMFHLY